MPDMTAARFYLGTHCDNWLKDPRFTNIPLFVSIRRLRDRVTLPVAVGSWSMDSGGFSEIKEFGDWTSTPQEYVAQVRRIVTGVGMPDFIAPQDWMCEPWVIFGRNQHLKASDPGFFHGTRAARGIPADGPDESLDSAVAKHQRRTVKNYLELRALAPDLPWMPVLQGWTLQHYQDCADLYATAGVDLAAQPIVGLGSVCRRQATDEIAEIAGHFHDQGLSLHGFGVKTQGLGDYGHDLTSADSMAWSMNARRNKPLPGHTHKNCANCPDWALTWHSKVQRSLARQPVGFRQPSLFPPLDPAARTC